MTYNPHKKPPMAHKVNIPGPYTPSDATDIRATFARERARLKAAAPAPKPAKARNVQPLRKAAP